MDKRYIVSAWSVVFYSLVVTTLIKLQKCLAAVLILPGSRAKVICVCRPKLTMIACLCATSLLSEWALCTCLSNVWPQTWIVKYAPGSHYCWFGIKWAPQNQIMFGVEPRSEIMLLQRFHIPSTSCVVATISNKHVVLEFLTNIANKY